MRNVTQELILEVMDVIVENTYLLITEKKTHDELLEENEYDFPVMFLMEPDQEPDVSLYELLIDHYEEQEEYEKCQELLDYLVEL